MPPSVAGSTPRSGSPLRRFRDCCRPAGESIRRSPQFVSPRPPRLVALFGGQHCGAGRFSGCRRVSCAPVRRLLDCSARLLTSCARPQNPCPVRPPCSLRSRHFTASRFDCSARSLTVAMISPIAWLCSDSRTMLSAMDSICSWMRCMPCIASSTTCARPAKPARPFARCRRHYVPSGSPSCAVLPHTPPRWPWSRLPPSRSRQHGRTCVVVARISAEEVDNCVTLSRNWRVMARLMEMPIRTRR